MGEVCKNPQYTVHLSIVIKKLSDIVYMQGIGEKNLEIGRKIRKTMEGRVH